MKRLFHNLLLVNNQNRNIFQIIFWWEIRRILYNVIVLISGIISIIIVSILVSSNVELMPGEDIYEPILIPVFAVLCNIGYTLGWLTEIFIKRDNEYGPKMFRRGLYFTLFWVFLPSIMWLVIAFVNLVKKH